MNITKIRIIILSFILLVLGQEAMVAQTHYEGSFYIGAKGGASFSQVFFNPKVQQSIKPGAVAGISVRYIEENHFGLIAELNFEQRGWKENFDVVPQLTYSRTLNYIQLPVMAHIFFNISKAKVFLNLGPEVGYMIGTSTSSNFDYRNLTTVPQFPEQRQTAQLTLETGKKFDFGISAGLGCELPISRKSSLALEGRFYYGLGNIVDCGRLDTFSGANSMSIMATMSYWFKVK